MNLKARFKPIKDRNLLHHLIEEAWQNYQDRIASEEQQTEVAESIARYFENALPVNELEILKKHNCITWHDHCNVRVYDNEGDDTARYREAFGIQLPRKVPCVDAGGYGYPHIAACEPEWGTNTPLRNLDSYFLNLLKMRKQYRQEYKLSSEWPTNYKKEHGTYPTWQEIADHFPVLGNYLKTGVL